MGLERMLDFLNEIEANENIEIKALKKELFINDSFLQKLQIDALNKKMEINADENYPGIKFYPYSALELSWIHSGKDFLYGGFSFSDWFLALSKPSDFWKIAFSLAPDEEVPEELKHFEKLSWFEQQSWCDDWRFGCFAQEKGVFPPQIVFYDRNWYTTMHLSLDEYFEAMFASCAVCGWQYFYIDYNQDIPHLSKAISDMENAVNQLPILFPDMDFSYHKSKLQELKRIKKLS